MTEQDRQALNDLHVRLKNIAADLKTFHDKGYIIGFMFNGPAGAVENFKVQHLIDLDITKKAN